jgi:hypothetical protein
LAIEESHAEVPHESELEESSRLPTLLMAGTIVVVATFLATRNLCACGEAKGTFSLVGRQIVAPPETPAVPSVPLSPDDAPDSTLAEVEDGGCLGNR